MPIHASTAAGFSHNPGRDRLRGVSRFDSRRGGCRARQAGVEPRYSESIHRHFSAGGIGVDRITGAMNGPNDSAVTAVLTAGISDR